MIRAIALLLAGVVCAAAQTLEPLETRKDQTHPPRVRRVVELKNLSGDRADRARRLVNDFMHPQGAISMDNVLKVAVLLGPEDVVTSAEALLRKFDSGAGAKSDNQVVFRFYLIEASPEGTGGPIPAEIAGAVDQMKRAFVYKSYRLLDTLLVNSRNTGQSGISGMLPAESDRADKRAYYNLNYVSADVVDEGKAVFVRDLKLTIKIPLQQPNGSLQFADTGIDSDITVREGQKLVLGKLSAEQGRSAIFVIVTADID